MKKLLFIICFLAGFLSVYGQNPATTIILANRNITLPCGNSCTSISGTVPHIKQATDYTLTRPAYVPYPYTTATGNVMTSIYTDDVFSAQIPLPFPFCFYGATYSALVMGSNDIITFDVTNANTANSWPLTTTGGSGTPVPIPYAGGTQGSAFSTYYPSASIMGPYHDILPTNTNGGLRKIEWRVEGIAPQRRFIASYNQVPMFSCVTTNATAQTVIYESTGIVEVYVHDKPICTGWNQGLAILGIQNFARDKAIAADGKNCTVWGGLGIDSCYRFIPNEGTPRFLSAELLVNGSVVATAGPGDTSTVSPGTLNINFPNICPSLDSTAYVFRVQFSPCGTTGANVIFTDTVFVKKAGSPTVTFSKTDANCTTNGSITVSAVLATGGPFEYSIDGGTTWQSSNVFNNVPPGNYNVTARKVGTTCSAANQPVTIILVNTLAISVLPVDANCTGGSITINASQGTPNYQYSIDGGATYQSSNTFNGLPAGTYNVVVRDAVNCTQSQSVTLGFNNNLAVSNNETANICLGGNYTSSFTATAGATFSWSPATDVSNVAALNPTFSPTLSTVYTLTVTLGTCTTQRTVNISVAPGVTANAGPDISIIAGNSHQIQASGSSGTILWTASPAGGGLSATNIIKPVATPVVTTTYTIRITNSQGCYATDDMTITVIPYCIKPMEAFTPNGDGINDLWLITQGPNCLTKARAQVFNRYGARVFEDGDYRNTWNGTYNGKPLPDGTYYYVISFKLLSGDMVFLKGNVSILR